MRQMSFVLTAIAIFGFATFPGRATAFPNVAKHAEHKRNPHATEVNELRSIKLLLERADHDYKGHRVAAIKDLSAAIRELEPGHKSKSGAEHLKGAHELQPVSDAQLREALKQLEAMRGQFAKRKGGNAKAAGHLAHAIAELKVALAIK